MGVESDRMVFDYLSRVGDLAQTALPAARRRELVTQLRGDIDRERGRRGGDSPAAVRRILSRIGTPDEVVEAAASSSPSSSVPSASAGVGPDAPGTAAEPPPGSYGPYAARGPRTGGGGARKRDGGEWWRKPAGPDGGDGFAPGGGSDGFGGGLRPGDELAGLPGMTGGVFIPVDDEELAGGEPRPPERNADKPAADERAADEAGQEPSQETAPAAGRGPRRGLPRLGGVTRGWGSPSLVLAAVLLVAGAVIGSWIPLALGWALGWFSRRLTPAQKKFGVLGLPGAAAAGLLVWLWGRDRGKWGTPIPAGHLGQAVQDALPTTVRLAASASALFLLYRARRSA